MDDGDDRSAWTYQLALWNTVGTLAGAMLGLVAISIALLALLR